MSIIQGSAMQGASRGFYPKEIEGSLRFNNDDGAYLSWTPDSAGDRTTFTFSCWVKRSTLSDDTQAIFNAIDTNNSIKFISNDRIQFEFYDGSNNYYLQTVAKYRDPSAWYNIVAVWDTSNATQADRMRLYVNGGRVTDFNISNLPTLNFQHNINGANAHAIGRRADQTTNYLDGYLAEVFFIDGTAHDADDFGETKNGVWVPKNITASDFTMGTNGFHLTFEDDTEVEAFNTVLYRGNSASKTLSGVGFDPDLLWIKKRDGTAREHLLFDTVRGDRRWLKSDTTDAESTRDVSFAPDGFTVGDGSDHTNSDGFHYVAWCWDAGANNASTGHSSLTWTGTGSAQKLSGLGFKPDLVWIKIRNTTDSHALFDSIRGVDKRLEANLTAAEATNASILYNFDTDGFTVGTSGQSNGSGNTYVGWAWDAGDGDPVSNTDGSITSTVKASTTNGFSIVSFTQDSGGGNETVGHGLSSAPDWIVMKRRDGTGAWLVNHSGLSSQSTHFLELNTTATVSSATPMWGAAGVSSTTFGVSDNTCIAGADYIAYCWHDVTGKQKFGSYTGTGSAGLKVTTGFRPGWVMVKNTDSGWHWIIKDGSRSPLNPSTESLFASNNNAEQDSTIYANFDFDDDGFTINSTDAQENANGDTFIYAAFAGSYSDYITDYNTDGSIDSRVKASDTTGFSIVSYEGTESSGDTIGHGLSSAPNMIIVKRRNATSAWPVYHSSLNGGTSPENYYLYLNSTNAEAADAGFWNNTAPTSSVITLGNYNTVNGNGDPMIAYCWTETTGVSKFGGYSGSSSEVTIDVGFNPAWVLIKNTSSAGFNWGIFDNTRNTDGTLENPIYPNTSGAEETGYTNPPVTFDGNNIKVRGGDNGFNNTGQTYIYAAFADTREAAFWLDQSSNDNDWQPNNLDHNDTVSDSPTDNFATWNPLRPSNDFTFSDGNLRLVENTTGYATALSTIGVSSGQYYVEIDVRNASGNGVRVGVVRGDFAANQGIGTGDSYGISNDAGNKYNQGSSSSYADPFDGDNIIGIALDLDAGTISFSINGNDYGTAFTGLSGEWFFAVSAFADQSDSITANFGQQPFKYSPPE